MHGHSTHVTKSNIFYFLLYLCGGALETFMTTVRFRAFPKVPSFKEERILTL